MKGFLVFVVIIGMILLYAGAQEVEVIPEVEVIEPVKAPDTRLKVKLIDELDDQYLKLENCTILMKGKLHIAGDIFNYTKTFAEGDRYEITIHIKMKGVN